MVLSLFLKAALKNSFVKIGTKEGPNFLQGIIPSIYMSS